MDGGSTFAIVAVITSLLTYVGAGDLVPLVGPAIQGLLAIISLAAGIYSWYSHRQKTAAMQSAGIR